MKVVRKGFWMRWHLGGVLRRAGGNVMGLLRKEHPSQREAWEQNLSTGREATKNRDGQGHKEDGADGGTCGGLNGTGPLGLLWSLPSLFPRKWEATGKSWAKKQLDLNCDLYVWVPVHAQVSPGSCENRKEMVKERSSKIHQETRKWILKQCG